MPHSKQEIVYILDDDILVCRSVAFSLREEGYQVEICSNAENLLSRKPPPVPSCLLLDLHMPGCDGVEVYRLIREQGWILPVIFISAHGTVPVTAEVMKAGAEDFLLKPLGKELLLQAVDAALAKSRALHGAELDRRRAAAQIRKLTPREQEVMQMVAAGHLNKQIAAALKISERTVKAHRARLMEKLGISSVAQLVPIVEKGLDAMEESGGA